MKGTISMKQWAYWRTRIFNLHVRWHNFKVRGTGKAYRHLTQEMRNDPDYANSWLCNIAMPIYDGSKGKLTIEEANEIAKELMRHLFNVKT